MRVDLLYPAYVCGLASAGQPGAGHIGARGPPTGHGIHRRWSYGSGLGYTYSWSSYSLHGRFHTPAPRQEKRPWGRRLSAATASQGAYRAVGD
ncbi:uncharacterized protein ASPGLDRAFT_54698 [Aspergillus glaucus CBS 516.65]|uniref:Uncharacterized protein n=1 Tax=Aspergillus glaucus CBS 516.65 TaxID=1160497 RepID=A0A1L9VXP7_ASPGL|nr:hypothetical protein ASPGLDRAFT_54698 [Aspergillus glaucus CBS 516.65]OJJ88698.1 hypothetical protein ASPGLDRAFT_54698 [Aspergillus glaucus CBS 516.65]